MSFPAPGSRVSREATAEEAIVDFRSKAVVMVRVFPLRGMEVDQRTDKDGLLAPSILGSFWSGNQPAQSGCSVQSPALYPVGLHVAAPWPTDGYEEIVYEAQLQLVEQASERQHVPGVLSVIEREKVLSLLVPVASRRLFRFLPFSPPLMSQVLVA